MLERQNSATLISERQRSATVKKSMKIILIKVGCRSRHVSRKRRISSKINTVIVFIWLMRSYFSYSFLTRSYAKIALSNGLTQTESYLTSY